MPLHSTYRRVTAMFNVFRHWPLGLAFAGLLALAGATAPAQGSTVLLAPQDLQIELPADSLFGALPVNRRLTVFIHVPNAPAWDNIPLAARFEISDTAPYLVPMDMDLDRQGYSATVDLGRLPITMGTPPKATPIHIVIGRPRGEQLEPLLRRTIIITIAMPGYADHHRGPADLSRQLTDGPRHPQHTATDLALLEGRLEEEELVGTRTLAKQDGYWKMLQSLIRQRLQAPGGRRDTTPSRRGPGIGFRLYANGEAQLIEVERSSGDLTLDGAALLAVVNAHPFPPFPPGIPDRYMDVHVEVPPRAY
ncbi:MAG: cell envelope integrity protein TolA [Nitrospira sp.]|nr:cell envelope integrity protein TolA [Nitrospira sp.]